MRLCSKQPLPWANIIAPFFGAMILVPAMAAPVACGHVGPSPALASLLL
jgi:hypothetical protein